MENIKNPPNQTPIYTFSYPEYFDYYVTLTDK